MHCAVTPQWNRLLRENYFISVLLFIENSLYSNTCYQFKLFIWNLGEKQRRKWFWMFISYTPAWETSINLWVGKWL